MKIKNLFNNTQSLDSIIKPKSILCHHKRNLIISPRPIIVNKGKKFINYMNTRKKNSQSKIILHNILFTKENDKNFSLEKKSYNISKFRKLLDSNNYNLLKKNLEVVIFELNALNKTIKEYKNNIDKLTTNLSELNNIKYEQKKLLENYISKKEIFEEKAKNLIKIIKNKNNVSDNKENYHVNITLKEIIYNNKNNFIYQLFQTLYAINIINDKKYYNIIKKVIDHAYLELKSEINTNQSLDENIIINNFFSNINKLIDKNNSYKKSIDLLIPILMKINIIINKINKIKDFLDSEYESNNKELNKKINEIKNKLFSLQSKKNKLIITKNKINEKIELLTKKNTPYCERTITQKNVNKKNKLLYNFSTEFINESNSNSLNNIKSILQDIHNKSSNSNNKTNRNSKHSKEKNYFIKTNPNYESEKYNLKKILTKLTSIKGTFHNLQNKKDKNSENNNKYELTNNYKRKKIHILNNEKYKYNLTSSYNNINSCEQVEYSIKNNNNKNFSNGCIYNNTDIGTQNKNNFNLLNINKYIQGKANRKELEKKINNRNNNGMEKKLIEKKTLNKDAKPIFVKLNKNFIFNRVLSINSSCKFKNIKNLKNLRAKDNIIKNRQERNICITFAKGKTSCSSNKRNSKIKSSKAKIDNTIKSFCYYKLLEKDSIMFNPLNNNIDLQNLEYKEGLISIDLSTNSIKIGQIHSYQNNSNYLSNNGNTLISSNRYIDLIIIELNKITNVYINQLMENIVKIHNIFLKYNTNKNKRNDTLNKKDSFDINKILNMREIMNIRDLSQEEKIKASCCNFFSLIVEYNNIHNIELIFINFNQFNIWFNYLKDILNNNIKSKKLIVNDSSSYENINDTI